MFQTNSREVEADPYRQSRWQACHGVFRRSNCVRYHHRSKTRLWASLGPLIGFWWWVSGRC